MNLDGESFPLPATARIVLVQIVGLLLFGQLAHADDAAIEVAQAHIRSNLGSDFEKLALTYGSRVMLMPGHEFLKKKYGLAGAGGLEKGAIVGRDGLIEAMAKASAGRPALPQQHVERILGNLKFESIEVHEGDFASGELQFKIRKGDSLIQVAPPKGDTILLHLRMEEGSLRVVSEYLDLE